MTLYTAAPRTVYFVRPVGKRGPIKIGCSINPKKRVGELQTIAGAPLEIEACARGSLDDERRVHSLFWHDHIGREWFTWSPYLQLLIDTVARGEVDWNDLPPTRVRRQPLGKRRPWTEEQKQALRDRRDKNRDAA